MALKGSKVKIAFSEIALFGVLAALMFGAKLTMAGLPNIEPVSLMVMLFAVTFGFKGLYPVYVYVAMEFLFFGFGIWNLYYLYVWAVLFFMAWLLRNVQEPIIWAILSGFFGLLFGAMCGIADIFIGGFSYALTKWAAGIYFDLLHCAGNFVMALLLFKPMRQLMIKLYTRIRK